MKTRDNSNSNDKNNGGDNKNINNKTRTATATTTTTTTPPSPNSSPSGRRLHYVQKNQYRNPPPSPIRGLQRSVPHVPTSSAALNAGLGISPLRLTPLPAPRPPLLNHLLPSKTRGLAERNTRLLCVEINAKQRTRAVQNLGPRVRRKGSIFTKRLTLAWLAIETCPLDPHLDRVRKVREDYGSELKTFSG